MLKQTTIFLHSDHMKRLGVLAKARGLKNAQMVRLAIVEFLDREAAKQAALAK